LIIGRDSGGRFFINMPGSKIVVPGRKNYCTQYVSHSPYGTKSSKHAMCPDQSDQIRRIFAYWMIVYFMYVGILTNFICMSPKILGYFFSAKSCTFMLIKILLGHVMNGRFSSQTHLVTLYMASCSQNYFGRNYVLIPFNSFYLARV
jgi:hypothetical protein